MSTPLFSGTRQKSVEALLPTVTVGTDGMFKGNDHFAIQGAIDYVARFGGGTVRVQPGHYRLGNTVTLPDSVVLQGSGQDTVLEKLPCRTTELTEDNDGCHWFISVRDTTGFAVGDGITISSINSVGGGEWHHSLHTICGIEANRIYLDRLASIPHWVEGQAKVTSIHSLIEARDSRNSVIRDLTLHGNKSQNNWLDGNYGAAIYLRNAENIHIHDVQIDNFNGDGISWQICHDVRVERCTIENMATLGLHPGTGSQRPQMYHNTIRNCHDGIYWCWDVNHGIARENVVQSCVQHGITIGHRDTDNTISFNTVEDCGGAGIFFRPERTPNRTAHRTLIEGNSVKCPADTPNALGISVVRGVHNTVLRNNTIVLCGQPSKNAIVIDESAVETIEENNTVRFQTPTVAVLSG
jgi:hypothetical protein